jgi:protoporphyrinogen oxidase
VATGGLAQEPKDVVVLGGGISGLGAAWRLVERGVTVHLLEAAPEVGGLAGTHRDAERFIDIGPHSLFSDDEEILRAILGLFEPPPAPHPRAVKFLYEGRYIDYPLTARGALLQMGPASGLRAALSLARGRLLPRRRRSRPGAGDEPSVEDWARENFGEHLYRTFFKPYTEQFWKIPCSELSADCIPSHTRLSFASTLRLVLRRRAPRAGASQVERETLPTYYPDRGFAEIPARVADAVTRGGGVIHLGCEATRVERRAGAPVRVLFRGRDGAGVLDARHVISTLPLPRLVGMLDPAPPARVRKAAAQLGYRALVVLGIVTRKPRVIDCDYIYQLHRPYNRVSRMNAFSTGSSLPGEDILVLEIPCVEGDATWRASAEELFEQCIASLEQDGSLGRGDVERLLLVRAPHAYPVYRTGWRGHLRLVREHLDSLGWLTTLGRSGEFRYMDIDRCLRRAFDVADDLVATRLK